MTVRLALVLLISAATAHAATDRDRFVVDGHAVSAALVASAGKIVLGEPVLLELRVSNETADLMYLVVSPPRSGDADAFSVTVGGPDGALPTIPLGPLDGNGITGATRLPATHTHVSRLLLSDWVTIDKPGRYTITVDKRLQLGVGRGDDWNHGATPHATHLRLVLTVAPGSPAQLGAVIDRLGAKLLAASDDEGRSLGDALASIHDTRVVPYFVKALALPDWERQFVAIRALGAYPNDASLAALTRALALPGNGRIAAAQAIASHKTAAGVAILWALRGDPDASFRLEILHAVARLNAPDVVETLTEMSRDASPMVAGEAKRYLAARRKP